MDHLELFPKIRISNVDFKEEQISEYIYKWINKYIRERSQSKLNIPLKDFGELDEALIIRIKSSTEISDEELQNYIKGHYLLMSAENMNGAILEEYLAQVLEPVGWLWCTGAVYKAIDFCFLESDPVKLLQVKNKYNTENSSSSAIRNGTDILKWNRLLKPRSASKNLTPISNWKALQEIINRPEINHLLTEDAFLTFIEKNSTSKLNIAKE